jgi:hypothetical protein
VVENVSVHPPAETAAEQISPVLALTVTVPVGALAFVEPTTLTLTTTGLPTAAGFGETEVIVVVVEACMTKIETLFVAIV